MPIQSTASNLNQRFKPFNLDDDYVFRKLDRKAQESNVRMVRLAKSRLKLTPMIDPADGTVKIVHEDGRFLDGYIGYDFIQVRLGDDYDNGFSRDSFASLVQYLKAVGQRFDLLTARKEADGYSGVLSAEESAVYVTRKEAASILCISESFLNSTIAHYKMQVIRVDGRDLLFRSEVERVGPPTSEVLEAEIKAFMKAPKR